jgi:thiamine-phosphate pyrophosphorylase
LPASLAEAALRLKGARAAGGGATVPACILIVERARLADPGAAIGKLPLGSAVILRDYGAADRAGHAARLARLCRTRRLRLLVAGDARLGLAVGGHGLHLAEAAARSGDRRWRLWRKPGWLVTAAAHSPRAAALARRAGVDALLLSPVFSTASHPEAAPLGPLRFAAWARAARLPVYALGGMTATTTRRLSGSGAAGIAAIGGFVP